MDHATYLEKLVAAYQGEVRGEAGFATLRITRRTTKREIWLTHASNERRAERANR